MATAANVQVNANTQQAVGAFNNLAAAIASAQQNTQQLNVAFSGTAAQAQAFAQAIGTAGAQLNRLNLSVNNHNQAAGNMANIHTTLLSVFDQLSNVLSKLFGVLQAVGSGIEFVFDSLVHEMDKIQGFNAMMLVTTKSASDAAQTYDFLRATADKLGVQFDAISQNYAKLVAAIPEGNNKMRIAESVFLGVAEAARTLHASNQDTQLMFYAVTQMAAKGTVSMEELRRQLAEKLPGALQIAARSVHATEAEFIQAVSKGSVDSAKFLQFFGDELQRTFHDSSEKASTSVSASINRLTNVWVDFVKNVLDSGAGQSIINIFDALREKLSDPYVIQAFSEAVKSIGDKITGFVKGLSSDDIHKGFDTFTKAVNLAVDAIGGMIKGLQWLIDHGGVAGATIGGIGGALIGARTGGGYGALIGGALGVAGGGYLGETVEDKYKNQPGIPEDPKIAAEAARKALIDQTNASRAFADAANAFAKNLDSASPDLVSEIRKNFNAAKLTTAQYNALNTILTSETYKTQGQKIGAVDDLAAFGSLMNPRASGLQDVLNGKQKLTPHERELNATEERAYGLDANYPKEMANLNELYHAGRLNLEAYNKAVVDLVMKQPIEKANTEALKKEQLEYNKGLEQYIDSAFAQVEVKEKIRTQMADEIAQSKMNDDELRAWNEAIRQKNELEKVGIIITDEKLRQMKLEIMDKNTLVEANKLGNKIQDQINNPYKEKQKQQDAMALRAADPSSGFTKQDQTNFTVMQDPNMKGSEQYFDAQKKQLEQYYEWIDLLRKKDVINEQTAAQAKNMANVQYQESLLSGTDAMFKSLASLSDSKNKELSRIGKAAAIADATIQGYLAIQRAIAAPPGWPYNAGGVVAASVLTGATIAKIASSGSYMSGGYTGDEFATNEVAGVVHGQEFVVNASATAKNRAVLESMNRGEAVRSSTAYQTNSKMAGMQIEVHNHGTPQDYTAVQMTESRVRLIAQDTVRQHAPRAVAQDLRNANGATSKGLRQNTLTARRRKL